MFVLMYFYVWVSEYVLQWVCVCTYVYYGQWDLSSALHQIEKLGNWNVGTFSMCQKYKSVRSIINQVFEMIYWKYSQDLLAATEKQYLWGKYSALSNYPINRASLNVLALFQYNKDWWSAKNYQSLLFILLFCSQLQKLNINGEQLYCVDHLLLTLAKEEPEERGFKKTKYLSILNIWIF